MFKLFASATAVAAVVVALASGALQMIAGPDLSSRYLITTIWCVIPLVWGCWALVTPASWLPERLPLWGAILGGVAGITAAFVLDMPSRLAGAPVSVTTKGLVVPLGILFYYLLWTLVRQAYRTLDGPAPTA